MPERQRNVSLAGDKLCVLQDHIYYLATGKLKLAVYSLLCLALGL